MQMIKRTVSRFGRLYKSVNGPVSPCMDEKKMINIYMIYMIYYGFKTGIMNYILNVINILVYINSTSNHILVLQVLCYVVLLFTP
jgi:hypothetical protein